MPEKSFLPPLPTLLAQIRQTLLDRCHDRLRDDSDIEILVDMEPKLTPWLTNILDPRELRLRVNQIMLLRAQHSIDGDCALALFLRVLAHQYDKRNIIHDDLWNFATQIDRLKRGKIAFDIALPIGEQRQFHILRVLYNYAETYPSDPKMPEALFWRNLASNANEVELIEAELFLLKRREQIDKEAWSDEHKRRIWILDAGRVAFRDLHKRIYRDGSRSNMVKLPPNKLDALASAHGDCASFIQRESELQIMMASLTQRAAPNTIILLKGQPQTGKTVLLGRLKRGLSDDYLPVSLEGKLLPRHDPVIFANRLCTALLSSCVEAKKVPPGNVEKPAIANGQAREGFNAFWKALWSSMDSVHPVIIIDEFGSLLEQVDCHLEVVTILGDLVDLACQGQCHLILAVSGQLDTSNTTMKILVDAIMNRHLSIQLRHYTALNTLSIMNALMQYLRFREQDTWTCLVAQVNGHPRLINEMLGTLAALASDQSRPLHDEMEVRHRFLQLMISKTNDLMRSLEEALSKEERLVILLICIGRPDIVQRPGFTIPGLIERAQMNNDTPKNEVLQISRALVEAGVRKLLQREWLQQDGGVSTLMYRFKIGIFLHWWHRTNMSEIKEQSAV